MKPQMLVSVERILCISNLLSKIYKKTKKEEIGKKSEIQGFIEFKNFSKFSEKISFFNFFKFLTFSVTVEVHLTARGLAVIELFKDRVNSGNLNLGNKPVLSGLIHVASHYSERLAKEIAWDLNGDVPHLSTCYKLKEETSETLGKLIKILKLEGAKPNYVVHEILEFIRQRQHELNVLEHLIDLLFEKRLRSDSLQIRLDLPRGIAEEFESQAKESDLSTEELIRTRFKKFKGIPLADLERSIAEAQKKGEFYLSDDDENLLMLIRVPREVKVVVSQTSSAAEEGSENHRALILLNLPPEELENQSEP